MTIWSRPRTSRRSSRIHLRKSVYKPKILSRLKNFNLPFCRVTLVISDDVAETQVNIRLWNVWVKQRLGRFQLVLASQPMPVVLHWRRVQLRRLEPLQLAWAKHWTIPQSTTQKQETPISSTFRWSWEQLLKISPIEILVRYRPMASLIKQFSTIFKILLLFQY